MDVWGKYVQPILMAVSSCVVLLPLPSAPDDAMPGFVDYMYKNILPACFLAPLRPSFDLNDGTAFIVSYFTYIDNHWLLCLYLF